MEQQMPLNTRIRLSAMMFLQYMYFAVFWVPLSAYLKEAQATDTQTWLILSTMAFGCLVSPLVCMIADRHFASNKVLIGLNLACAVLLFLAARQENLTMLFVFLLIAMFCYMPTWSITNAIAMANCPAEKFPQIRSLGSIGWVASLVFSLVALKMFDTKIDNTAIPLMCGAATALVAALVNLTLPNTPPPAKGRKASVVDALGLRALTLIKDANFALFILLSMLVMIPFTLYFSLGSQFFDSQGFTLVTATMNLGQLVEMGLMLLVPISLAKFGIKKTMLIGLIALVVRYAVLWGGFAHGPLMFYYIAILIHGVIFGFFFVGGQVYVDKKAPPEIRAQAQGLIVLICFGAGMLVGNFVNVKLIRRYTADDVCNWSPVFIITAIVSVVLLVVMALFFRDDIKEVAAAAEPPAPEAAAAPSEFDESTEA
ncbi:MAG: MFS transporter [Planctomycetota bacterium]|nr:MAG: MFS transporter [Planctomycetota bacterium]